MPDSPRGKRPTLVVLASTYPRWSDDHEPGFVHELAKRLVEQFRVVAVVPSAPGAASSETLDGVEVIRYRYAPRRWETLVNDGGIIINLRRHRWKMLLLPTFLLMQAWTVWRLSRIRCVDVVHAHWLLPQGLVVALLSKFWRGFPPYAVTSHGADLFALKGRCSNTLKRFVVRRASAVTVVSEAMRQELERIDAEVDKISVQPMGVDLVGKFTPDSAVGRSSDEILFVGRLVEKKGLSHLIEAMPVVLMTRPAACLDIIGAGPERRRLDNRVAELGLREHVRFLGALPQQNLPEYYRAAALFVAPFVEADSGDQEGLGLVVAEAMACACPVLVGDVAGVRDLVNTTTGVRVDALDHMKLAASITNLLRDDSQRHRLALAGRKHVLLHYSWSAVAENYARLLCSLVDRGQS